jgi:S-adenosylmethionine:tRNA ribosyltransferase-isomerase
MRVDEFDFDLPPDLIAQEPSAERLGARLLCLPRARGPVAHHAISDLPGLLHEGDLLVVNNTRVFPARLLGRRLPGGGGVECLLVARLGEPTADGRVESWDALMHPGQRLKPGSRVVFEGATTLHGEVLERRFFGRREIRLWTDGETTVEDAVNQIGHMPLPPYIRRADRPSDRDRYQTIFARSAGSVAAPTAGLHFTPPLVASLRARGVRIAELTLHVGYGTFQPVRVTQVEEHRIEPERYEISEETALAVNEALETGGRVVAVGTTTTRTLEAVALEHGGRLVAGAGSTGLFVHPGFTFQVLSGLMTNFHLPRSSLLMLVAAFAGRERVLDAYRSAVAARYRFYSYGDAMLIL